MSKAARCIEEGDQERKVPEDQKEGAENGSKTGREK
jgi:hypothetical protein